MSRRFLTGLLISVFLSLIINECYAWPEPPGIIIWDWKVYTTVGESVDVIADVEFGGPIYYWDWDWPYALEGTYDEYSYSSTATVWSNTPGQYTVDVEGEDDYGQWDSDWAYVYVIDVEIDTPSSFPAYVELGNNLALGSTSYGATGGTYSWTKVSGPGTVTFSPSASDPDPDFSANQSGNYTVKVEYTKEEATASDTSGTITVVKVVDVISSKDVFCLGENVTFVAITNPMNMAHLVTVTWSGGENPATGSGSSFMTNWSTPGTKTVTATCGTSSAQKSVKIVEVASLLPDEGTEIDDGDNDPNTKLFVVCVVPPSPPSTLTVTATPNPSVSEDDLPACWTLTGGIGTGKLTRTVDKTTPGETVITCTCNESMKETTIWVVRGEVSLASSYACDGEEVDVDLILTPISVKGHITSVQWQATEPVDVTNYGSPSGQGLTFSQRSADITEWKIDNARWYANQQDLCNDTAEWEIEATYEIAGSHSCSTDYDPTTVVTFTASASAGTGACLDGKAWVDSLWSGSIQINTQQLPNGQWEATISQGTWQRDVQASSWWSAPANSQYYNMVKDEEQFHEGQYEGTTSTIFDDLWDDQIVMADATANQPFVAATEAAARQAAESAFNTARQNEEYRSYLLHAARLCPKEQEAKTAAGSSHRVAMPCTYPNCP